MVGALDRREASSRHSSGGGDESSRRVFSQSANDECAGGQGSRECLATWGILEERRQKTDDRIPKGRKSKTLAQARSVFALNPDFGYLNSQVPDKTAFRRFVSGPAGAETQLELQELSQRMTAPCTGDFKPVASLTDTKPANVKIEKENTPTVSTVSHESHLIPGRLKRPRLEVHDAMPVKTEELEDSISTPAESSQSTALRIAQLENEVAFLRAQIRVDQDATDSTIQGLQRDWEDLRRTSLYFHNRVDGLRVRVNRVEGHIDEIVEHLPAHYGWKSEIGSDYDPDATLDMEDRSQPVVEAWWPEESM
ncbi:hypothetical protein B0H12DRAFT_1067168 [Mycena haematopus]|nr:hypothetical protein B0H12DRAFT_1067168 [Mycena haematopus]